MPENSDACFAAYFILSILSSQLKQNELKIHRLSHQTQQKAKMTQPAANKEAIASALKPKQQPTQQELEQAATEMLAQQPMMDEEMQRICSVIIVDLNSKEIHLKTVVYEHVIELRELLAEHIYTCFFTNFYFEHAGQRLSDYTQLSELDLEANPRIIMKPDKYDEGSARTHIKRLVDILESPPVLTLVNQNQAGGAEEQKPRSRSQSQASQNNGQDGSDVVDKEAEEQKIPPEMLEQDEKMKQSYKEFYDVVRAHQDDEIALLNSKDDRCAEQKVVSSVEKLLNGSMLNSDLNRLKHVKCIESIEFSDFNPMSDIRKMAGDLFYLTVRTLENPSVEHGITCCVNGFYKNDNSERSVFSPMPSQRGSNPCFSYTLVGCLNQLSPSFGRSLQVYLGSILKTEPYFISPITRTVENWLVANEEAIKVTNAEGLSQTVSPLHGFNPKQMREWNEEFQVVKSFTTDNYLMRVQKERAAIKVYQDFVEAAVSGAKAIIEGKLTSLNPNEPVRQHVYVYNYIFFSYAVDTPLSNNDLTSSDQFPSYTQANHDIKGLQIIKSIDVGELHHLATCLVDYKGQRIICQSIIPGILNNSDLSSLAEYGTVDEKKTIVATEQFHAKMLQVAEALNLKVNKVIDPQNGQSIEIAGSTEVKGIHGSDKRDYIVDLQGIVPRDANYLGEENHTCLVRPELLSQFQRTMAMDYAAERIKVFSQQLDEERQATLPKAEEGKELTEEQKTTLKQYRIEDNAKRVREVERLIKEAPKQSWNVNVFKKNVKLDMTAAELEVEEKNVQQLASFINDKAIPNLVQDLKQQDGIPVDSNSLEDFFHRRGINMRYLGQVYSKLGSFPKVQENMNIHLLQMMGDYKHIKTLLEREIFLRSAKHVISKILREDCGDSDIHLAQAVAHCLNCILAPLPSINALNSGKMKPVDEAIQNSFQFFPDETVSRPRGNSLSASPPAKTTTTSTEASVSAFDKKTATAAAALSQEAQSTENMTKKQLKKLKQKQNKQAAAAAQVQNDAESKAPTKTSMSEILFRQNEQFMGEQEEFNIDDIFSQPVLASGLHRLSPPTFFSITPRDIYEKVKEIAHAKFGHELPAEQKKLGCLQTVAYKSALMRDLCRVLGVQLIADPSRKLFLGDKIKAIVACLNESIQAEQAAAAQGKKRKQAMNQQLLTEQDVLSDYKYMPFQSQHIGKLFANVKQMKQEYGDVKACLAQANQYYKESQLDRAFELYSQGINMMLQITGAMNEEVASSISSIASIQFKFGDFLQAIELQSKAIVLQERLLGVDHPQVGNSYATLSMYYHNVGYFAKGFEYLHRALDILRNSIGEYHPEIASIFTKMGMVYQEINKLDAALEAYIQHLDQSRHMFGEEHIQTASSHQAIALVQYRRQEFRKALESQEQAHTILKKLLPDQTNPIIAASKQQLDMYFKLSVQMEKQKQVISRAIGENKQKVDPRFLKAVAEAKRIQQMAQAAGQAQGAPNEADAISENTQPISGQTPEIIQQRKQAAEAFQRYQGLVKKLQDPKAKRDFLDVLEYQAMQDNMAAQQKAQQAATPETKQEAKKEE